METYASDDINEEDVSELSSQNPHGLFVGGGGIQSGTETQEHNTSYDKTLGVWIAAVQYKCYNFNFHWQIEY